MPKALKYILIALTALLGLLLAAIGVIAATFNPNDYKPLIIKLVQEKKQRTLQIPGAIKLTFFPRVGADLGKLSISEHNGTAEFAAIDSAKVALQVLPLLSQRLVVDQIRIDGLTADIKRHKDGTTNFDDLLSSEESGSQIKFDIDSIRIGNAKIRWDDQQAQRKFEIAKLDFSTGRVASGVPSEMRLGTELKGNNPALDATLSLKSSFMFDLEQKHYTLKDSAIEVKGKLADFSDLAAKLTGTLSGDLDKQTLDAPQLKLSVTGKQGDTAIDGSLTTPLAVNMKTRQFELPNIVAAFSLPNPGGGVFKLSAGGKANLDLGKQTASMLLKGKLDETSFDAKLGLTKFAPVTTTFDINIDRIDADRYKGKPGATAQSATPDKPLDLSALHALQANGNLRIDTLKISNLKASNVRLALRASGGKLEVNPLLANLYGGSVTGSVSATASAAPHFILRQNLVGIDVGPLLKDAIGKDPIEGRGNVMLDVGTEGGAFAQMKKNLNGSARMELRDGALHGINMAQVIRNAKAKIGMLQGKAPAQSGTGTGSEKTDFSELSGSFRIANGVAHNEDLSIKSPLIRVGGAGDINLGDERLDYLAKATVVSTLQGQGGPELQALKGLTIPVRLSGPFAAIGWRIEFESMATDLAKQKVEEQKSRLQDQLKEKFKGLFGK